MQQPRQLVMERVGNNVHVNDADTGELVYSTPWFTDHHQLDLLSEPETLISPDGIEYAVLDPTKLDFNRSVKARKSTETLVWEAKDGQVIQTKNTKGEIESEYTTKQGDAIFVNPHNPDDQYVPGDSDGTRWQFNEIESKGYIILRKDDSSVWVKNNRVFLVLHEAVTKPTCIKDAWGPGNHQFLYPGATLKMNDNKEHVTGIDKSAFDKTWEIVSDL